MKDIALLRWDQVGDEALDITPSKTKKHGIRVLVPLHSAVQKELRLLDRAGEYVFPVLAGRYQGSNPESGFMAEVLNQVEIDKEDAHITFHCWRHTFRTMLSVADVDKEIAMKLGGWTNESTSEIYDHFDNFDQLQAAIRSLK